MQAGVLHLCRWLTACVEGLAAAPYDVRESLRSGKHRSGLGGRRSELWMHLLFSVQGAPNLGGCTEHRSSQFTYTFSLYTWMTKNVNGFEYLRLCEGRDRYLGSELYLTPGPVSFSRPHRTLSDPGSCLVLPPSQAPWSQLRYIGAFSLGNRSALPSSLPLHRSSLPL
ncbi:hypothetical protein HaLaN_31056, partial [Haematococcus lacustris]